VLDNLNHTDESKKPIAILGGWKEPSLENYWHTFISTKAFFCAIISILMFPINLILLFSMFFDSDTTIREGGVWLLSFALLIVAGRLHGKEIDAIFEKFYQKGLAAVKDKREKERKTEEKRVRKLVDETISKGGLENYQHAIEIYGEDPQYFGGFENTKKLILEVKAKIANEYEILLDYNKAIEVYNDAELLDEVKRVKKLIGDDKVEHLDYDKAIEIYESIGDKAAAKNARKLKAEQGKVKVTQKIVHGDEVTKTEIKDSVLNRSSVGSGGDDKLTKIKELKKLHDAGAIDDDEFKQMKKEILGK